MVWFNGLTCGMITGAKSDAAIKLIFDSNNVELFLLQLLLVLPVKFMTIIVQA